MATSSISGLVSGLDTATIIDQLMQLEAVSQDRLKTQQTAERTVLSSLQSLNTDTALLAGKADTLAKAATWQTMKATSSGTSVSATAGATATATSFAVTVNSVAVAHQVSFAFDAPTTGTVTTGPLRLDFADPTKSPIQLTTDGTLQGLADAINDPTKNTGLTATIVRTGADPVSGAASYGLVVTGNKTGAASAFTLTHDDAGGTGPGTAIAQQSPTFRQGTDAKISLGAGLTLTSTTNTFADVTPGVSVTLAAAAKVGDTSTITVAQDGSGVKAGVQGLVDQLNALLTKIDGLTAPATSTAKAGALSGDPTARSLRSALVNTVFGVDGQTSMANLGIQTDRYGKLVFDPATFDKAYAADPAAVTAQFTKGATTTINGVTTTAPDGWAARLQAVAGAASDAKTGTITAAITGQQTSIDRLDTDIADWDSRLALRREGLTRQFTALETALSNMKSQGNWLASQLATLPTSSS